jgi:hypothetical protein
MPYLSPMNQSTENELFTITLTPSGSTYLLRLYNLAKWIFLLIILITLMLVGDTWVQNLIYARNYPSLDWMSYLAMNIYYIFNLVIALISIVQLYFFLYFTRLCNNAIRQQQTEQFNASFKWLFRNTVCACIMLVVELIGSGMMLYSKFWMAQHMPLK